MITYQVEPFRDFAKDIQPLIKAHYEEIALFRDKIELKPCWDRYFSLDDAGLLHVCTVRDDSRLIGYYINIVMPHLHYADSLTAGLDIYFILPEYRNGTTGIKLFQFMEQEMRKLGVQVIYTGTKRSNDISKIWERLGYDLVETKYGKYIGD